LYVKLKWWAATCEVVTSSSSDNKNRDYYSGDLGFMNPTVGCPAGVVDKKYGGCRKNSLLWKSLS